MKKYKEWLSEDSEIPFVSGDIWNFGTANLLAFFKHHLNDSKNLETLKRLKNTPLDTLIVDKITSTENQPLLTAYLKSTWYKRNFYRVKFTMDELNKYMNIKKFDL